MARKKLKRIGVLCSGGLDSLALVADCLEKGFETWPVFIRSQLPWEKVEIRSARKYLRKIRNPLLKPLSVATLHLGNAYKDNWSRTGRTPSANSQHSAVFLPARNLLLTTKCLLLLSSVGVFDLAIATLKGNPFPDGKVSYFRLLERVYGMGFRRRVRIHAPFRNRTKGEIIRDLGQYPLHLSMSCINPQAGVHCSRCNKCSERKKAFREAGFADPTRYATNIKSRTSPKLRRSS